MSENIENISKYLEDINLRDSLSTCKENLVEIKSYYLETVQNIIKDTCYLHMVFDEDYEPYLLQKRYGVYA